jgi:uncharacterized protein YukE
MGKLPHVNWNTTHAEEAIRKLKQSALLLRTKADERNAAANAAAQEWAGPFREDFDEHTRNALRGADALAEIYEDAAATIARNNERAKQRSRQRQEDEERRNHPI